MEVTIKTIQLAKITTNPTDGNVDNSQQVTAIEIVGDVDANTAPLLQERVLPLAQPNSKILLDMTNVPYMSSAGLRLLLSLYRQVTNKNGQLVLVGLADEILDTMSITGFLEFFTTFPNRDSGLAALK